MSLPPARVRVATIEDVDHVVRLWQSLFGGETADGTWRNHARRWLGRAVADAGGTHVAVVEVAGIVVATAVGTLEVGVPNPHCPRGRAVRIANVFTVREHRRNGYASRLVRVVIDWARAVGADRVDLSSTPDGRRVYERAGFVPTTAPRMKLML